jgi:PmbA protein
MEKKKVIQVISDRLSRTRGIEFEIFLSRKKSVSIGIKDGNLDHFRSSVEIGLALRVLKQGKVGFAYLFGPTPEGLDHLADRAIELASQTDTDPYNCFPHDARSGTPDLELFDASLETIPDKEKIAHVREMEHSALSSDPRIKKARRAEYDEAINHVSLLNSRGLDLEREETRCTMSIMLLAEDHGSSEMGWELGNARFYTDLDPIRIGISAAQRATQMLGGRQIGKQGCHRPARRLGIILLRGECVQG